MDYYLDGVKQTEDTRKEQVTVWEGADDQISVADDGALTKTYAGYSLNSLTPAGTKAGTRVDTGTVISLYYVADADTKYTVEHYFQNLNDSDFTIDTARTQNLTGKTGTQVTATALSVDGFTFDDKVTGTKASGEIAGDGSLVLKLYYTRNSYTVTYQYTGTIPGSASPLPANATYKYGASVNVADSASATDYTFSGWNRTGIFTMPAANVVISGSFTYSGGTITAITAITVPGPATIIEVPVPAAATPAVLGVSRTPAVAATPVTTEQPEVLGATRGRATGDESQDGMRVIVILICAGAAVSMVWGSRKKKESDNQ